MDGRKIALALLVVCIGALHVSWTEAFPVTEVMGILRSHEFERQLKATITQLPRYKTQILEVYRLALPAIEKALQLVRIPPSIFVPPERSVLLKDLGALTGLAAHDIAADVGPAFVTGLMG